MALLKKGIGHTCAHPRTPQLHDKVECTHQPRELHRLLEGHVIVATQLSTEKLTEWEDCYD